MPHTINSSFYKGCLANHFLLISIIEDTNPGLRVPIGFAGGLHDRDLGFVRFGWRDYDTFTGRWTAPDPIGDRGGDPDWYGYCLDDPVNGVDPLGLEGGFWGGVKKIGPGSGNCGTRPLRVSARPLPKERRVLEKR